MAVSLLHYRTWEGRFRSPFWGIWPIARTALRTLFSRKLFWWHYANALLIFLMFFFGGYLLAYMPKRGKCTLQLGRGEINRLVRIQRTPSLRKRFARPIHRVEFVQRDQVRP